MQANYAEGLITPMSPMATMAPMSPMSPMSPMATMTSGNSSNDACPCYSMQCIPQETVICNVMLARAYVPFQRLCSIYSPDTALEAGTAFPELHQPYHTAKDKPDCTIMPLREESNHVFE
jgi:hypothetical protein